MLRRTSIQLFIVAVTSCGAACGGSTATGGGTDGGGTGGTSSGTGGTSSGTGGGGNGSIDCGSLCQQAPRICTNDKDAPTCTTQCQNLYATYPQCKSQFDTAYHCGLAQPVSNFHCDEDGETVINDDVCTAEFDALIKCITGA